MRGLKIGELARKAGVSVDTVRYYERRGLLPEPDRRPSGFRIYSADTAERIRLAKFLQALGFNLDEIVVSLNEIDRGALDRKSAETRLANVVARVDARIAELQSVRENIDYLVAECCAGRCQLAAVAPSIVGSRA